MKKHRIVVELEAPDDASTEEVVTSVEMMLSIGKADAQDTMDDDEVSDEDTELSAEIEIVSVTGE